ncbi:hypothetical protein [Chondromyces crocatus]|uniref:hypothetical protein n=1 Tax=Chondromyces crocatus TaxID=52 RepID=UPI0012E1B97F|nr:hypothetical protein [Chondromyces crocatus]
MMFEIFRVPALTSSVEAHAGKFRDPRGAIRTSEASRMREMDCAQPSRDGHEML